jgi:NADH-quinone oxidoreductase subunit M
MSSLSGQILTLLLLCPLASAILAVLLRSHTASRIAALCGSLLTLVIALIATAMYDPTGTGYGYGGTVQLTQRLAWIPSLNIEYLVGVDGLSLPIILLTCLLFPLALLASWNMPAGEGRSPRAFGALMLLLQAGLIGSFISLDLILFYVFFEVSLLPMYFLIGIYGGAKRTHAAIKFFLYTLVGSVSLLIAIVGIYLHTKAVLPTPTFDLIRLAQSDIVQSWSNITAPASSMAAAPAPTAAVLFFSLLVLGFLVKLPSVPLHTWLPDAHVQAPTPGSMILAGIVLKMGGYGLFRVAYPLFPDAAISMALPLAVLGAVSIVYAALVCLAQHDFKRLVAFSSVSHMGYVLLGLAVATPAAITGSAVMLVAHGLVSAMLFFVVGTLYERTHTYDLRKLGGLASLLPGHTAFTSVGLFANLGLPGLAIFVAELLVFIGLFSAAMTETSLLRSAGISQSTLLTLTGLALAGVVLSAAYNLRGLSRAFFGPVNPALPAKLADLTGREATIMATLAILTLLLGVLPAVVYFPLAANSLAAFTELLK